MAFVPQTAFLSSFLLKWVNLIFYWSVGKWTSNRALFIWRKKKYSNTFKVKEKPNASFPNHPPILSTQFSQLFSFLLLQGDLSPVRIVLSHLLIRPSARSNSSEARSEANIKRRIYCELQCECSWNLNAYTISTESTPSASFHTHLKSSLDTTAPSAGS